MKALAHLTFAILVASVHAQGPGRGRGGMPADFQDKIHQLFAAPEKIRRSVDLHTKGYTAITTTTDPELAPVLQTHVEQMSGRLDGGQRVRRWDPAFEEFFAHYEDMDHKFTKLENGIRAEIFAKTPEAITAAHNHARIIHDFSSRGATQMHQPHRTLLDEDGGEADRFRGGPRSAREAKLAKTFGARAEEAGGALIKALGTQLKTAIKTGGPESALAVCKTVAIPLTESTTAKFDGLTITRVTDKPRNPANAADKIDLATLEHFRKAKAEPKTLAHLTTAADGKTVRYYRPLAIQAVCLNCHGDRAAMSAGLRALLEEGYPEDKAHGYELGDLRGLIRIEAAAD